MTVENHGIVLTLCKDCNKIRTVEGDRRDTPKARKGDNVKNTITFKQVDLVEKAFNSRLSCLGEPRFYGIFICGKNGEEWDGRDENDAVYAEIEVHDYDGMHDFQLLRETLQEVGVEVDETEMLSPYECRDLPTETVKPYIVEGDTIDPKPCRLFGYGLVVAR